MSLNNEQEIYAKRLLHTSNNDINAAIDALKHVHAESRQVAQNEHAPNINREVIVTVQDVSKRYKVGKSHVQALNNVSLQIYKGEFLAITGTSGSGKSTLLQTIGGLDKPTSGTIEINGKNIGKLSDAKLSEFRSKTVGFVFQFFYLQPFLDLQTNIGVPAMFARTKRQERKQRSTDLANLVGLSERLKHLPNELSGGQLQRTAIARALQNSPTLLLADEPTGNLDRTNAKSIFELFKAIRDQHGTTIVVVTHDEELAMYADRRIKMQDGAII